MLKIGVLGAGHLGKIHIKCIKEIDGYDLIGFYDTDVARVKDVELEYGIKGFGNVSDLIKAADVVDIVTPTISHFECATSAIENLKHVFIEKPITATLEEADRLLVIAKENSVLIQVGHIERLNPALLALQPYQINPKFIEIQRLAP